MFYVHVSIFIFFSLKVPPLDLWTSPSIGHLGRNLLHKACFHYRNFRVILLDLHGMRVSIASGHFRDQQSTGLGVCTLKWPGNVAGPDLW